MQAIRLLHIADIHIGMENYGRVDPKTGLGLTTRSGVTILAPTGIAADALASAVSVLGPQAGLKLIEGTAQTEALILTEGVAGAEPHPSSGFDKLLEAD